MLFTHFYLVQGKNRDLVFISRKQRIFWGLKEQLFCEQIDKKRPTGKMNCLIC